MTKTKLNALIAEITVNAVDDEEQLWAFLKALQDNIPVPCAAMVIGEPVQVTKFDYDGNARRGLTATCVTPKGLKHVVGAADIAMPPESPQAKYLDAYRQWIGIKPLSTGRKTATKKDAPPVAEVVELAVLSIMQQAAHCRMLAGGETVTLRAKRLWDVVPGEIATVKVNKQWSYSGHAYLSGEIESTRLDAKALGLTPLGLEDCGVWDPAEQYWGEPGDPIDSYARPIIAWGPRRRFEMEQIIPGEDPEDPLNDPIIESNDRKNSGDLSGAFDLLMGLCRADLRCLDAHSHLGNLAFDRRPIDAIRHYEVGVRIGELSLGEEFNDVLPWGLIDNRPFLRCLNGFGLCLWRLERFEESAQVLDRILWLNPTDNQGVRCLIDDVRSGRKWEEVGKED